MSTMNTRQVVERYFTSLERGDLDDALALLADDIDFELPVDEWNAVIPYLGRHVGIEAVRRAFAVRGETTEVLDYELRDLRAEGDTAFALIYTRARQTRTLREFEIEDSHRLVVGPEGKITHWKVYFDPNTEVAAFNADLGERLVAAVWAGDVAQVGELLRDGAHADRRDPGSGLTPLMIAAGRADAALVRQLLDAGADVYAADSRAGTTALHKACQGGSLAVVRALVEAGAFVDAVAPTTGHTPLMDALWYKYPDIAKYLLDQGAGLGLSTHYGFSLKEHFEYELNVNTHGKDLLLQAERHIRQREQDDARKAESQRLMTAVTAGDAEAVRALLQSGARVDERFPVVNGFNDAHTPLLVASRDGHTEAARLLLEAGADVNATEPTFGAVPLHKAVYNGHVELTRLIANWPGVDLDYQGPTNGYTPLHDALWHGYEECADVLVKAGARLDLVGHDGKTPRDVAVDTFGADHPLVSRLTA
ncbi:ankyrin repeat domain-containing protein [Actinomadura oligospora]|uniref:ankyrin repeat domain-containing protein n=1 Tax=Actinomadura oligospora TaxID=111804 RepID=UPI00047D00C6|nr:ankyrin repeat domain-containing protein [Actinomadura oligospora]